MTMYVLKPVNEAQKDRLRNSGVAFNKWGNGVLVDGEYAYQTALRTLDATANEVQTRDTSENYREMVLTFGERARAAGELLRARDQWLGRPTHSDDGLPEFPETRRPYRRQTFTPTPSRGRERGDANDPREISRQNYIDACAARFDKVRAQATAYGMPMLAEVKAQGAQHVEVVRVAEFATAAQEPDALRQRFEAELERIYSLEKVRDVRVMPGTLLVYTNDLVAVDESGRRYEIGRFMISIQLKGRDAGVRWFNSTRRVDAAGRKGMNAPYVYADGNPSNDEILVTMMDMIGRCELASLVDVAIQYIETVDANNPLTEFLDSWPQSRRFGGMFMD